MEDNSTAEPRIEMSQWCIYNHPRDFPDKYVMRRWDIRAGQMAATDDMALADTLEEIRADILALEKETEGLLGEIIGGKSA